MTIIRIPSFLHDVFGETQSRAEIALILGFGAIGTLALVALDPWALSGVVWWRAALAVLVMFDVLAGAVANLTGGTNDHYAARPRARWLFIAIHIHLPLLTLLLGDDMFEAVAMWLYTVAAASAVNRLGGSALQRPVAGALFGLGTVLLILLGDALLPSVQAVAVLFMFKVIYAFGVNHRAV